ncbi:PH domain-containing protein [Candidatus Woesebacteria bacterium]|nr:PH domain-containing protein [Candidatus Woesebacteria bacterium]
MVQIPETDAGLSAFRTKNPLTSFAYEPENVRFMDQDPEEKIILFLRWHPITNLGWVLLSTVLFLAPSFLGSFPFFSSLPLSYKSIIVLLWYLIAVAYVYEKFLHWYFSGFLVTNKRVIDIDFINLIYREVSFASLDKIQDVTIKAGGGGMTLFNYGNVFIQTAGEIPNVEFEKIPKPDKVVKVLKGLILQKNQTNQKGQI